ncbi:MAG: DNA primase [Patescibacteria group bacterium]|nr:DNA primase [Patescibacteria group bacterium]
MNQPSDEIKSRLDIVDVIRDYIQLKPAGINFRALCPFHREKTPSFMVSPEKQIWHCFGCSKGGDIFSFVMEMEGISFVEALRLLAPKAGVRLKRQDPKLTSQRNRLLDIIESSSKYYHEILLKSGSAGQARKYLAERGLTEETIEEWRIGYSPDSWDDLINFLKTKGYSENEIFLAGMIVKKGIKRAATLQKGGQVNDAHANENNVDRFYNRFRGRIMFPIKDVNGLAVAFSARVSPEKEAEEKMGKYINSPQTMIYDKSKILFGMDKARMEIKKQDLAIIVEGQMDVITAHQHGFKNVVASSGTALTFEQVKLAQRYTNNLTFALDADMAGELAISRGEDIVKDVDYQEIKSEDSFGRIRKYIDPLLSYNMNIKIVEMPNGKDPDECIKNSPEEWQKAVKEAKPIMQYHFDKILTGLDLDNIEDRRQATKKLLPKIAKLNNKIEQDFWLKKLSQTIDVAENFLFEALSDANPPAGGRQSASRRTPIRQSADANPPAGGRQETPDAVQFKRSREEKLSELLLALILKFPLHIEYATSRINTNQIIGSVNRLIYRSLIIYYNKAVNDWTQQAPIGQEVNSALEINYQDFKDCLAQNIDDKKDDKKKDSQPQVLHQSAEQAIDMLALLADKDFYNYSQEQAKDEIIRIIITLKKSYLADKLREITKLIAQTEEEGDEIKLKDLMEKFKGLTEEMGEIKN